MKKGHILIILLAIFFISLDADAQRYRRYQRRHDKVHERIEAAHDKGKLDANERAEISKKEKKLHKTNKRALRNGEVTNHEQNKLNRRLRKVKRETRRAEKD